VPETPPEDAEGRVDVTPVPSPEHLSATEAAHFRSVLGRYPTGVVVVTTEHDGEQQGMACNSFTSVSLDPPLVAFCPARASSTWPRMRPAGRIAINVLGAEHEELSHRFAARHIDRFDGVETWRAPGGSPVLQAAIGWMDCTIEAEYDGGDHTIVVVRVEALGMSEGDSLVFMGGAYGKFSAAGR
jgi:3-hydroxy-9,10-secoandrosta-1,3,5(10)-triene-9,17-dione monooxygenase reductase component